MRFTITTSKGTVAKLRLISRTTNTACFVVDGNYHKLDLSKDVDKATFSLLLAAKISGKKVRVLWYNDPNLLEGGCDTGRNVKKLYYVDSYF